MTAKKKTPPAPPGYEWSDLVDLLRRYKPADASPAWEHDFKVEVEKIVAIFAAAEHLGNRLCRKAGEGCPILLTT